MTAKALCPICNNDHPYCPHWFLANSGREINPHIVNHEDLNPYWIAKSLSKVCRYNGHTKHFYSVAQHSVYVSLVVPREHAFCGLMHDATESICQDIIRPLKITWAEYAKIEEGVWQALSVKFGLPLQIPAEVKRADNEVLLAERDQLLPKSETKWHFTEEPADIKIEEMNDRQAFDFFAERWNQLAIRERRNRIIEW